MRDNDEIPYLTLAKSYQLNHIARHRNQNEQPKQQTGESVPKSNQQNKSNTHISKTRKSKGAANHSEQRRNKLLLAVAFYAVLALLVWRQQLPVALFGWYLLAGAVTFFLYAKDKKAAQHHTWRIPEMQLHVCSVLGGWVGAMLAQQFLRHKTQKPDFRLAYYLTVVINLGLLLAAMIRYGNQ